MKIFDREPLYGKEIDDVPVERIMVPLNEYQMANLIDAISQVECNGDWYHEFCAIVARAMKIGGIKTLRSNRGRTFSIEDVRMGRLK
jgi:hypothetical protein